jgi:ketosteroid isomerase-like protein
MRALRCAVTALLVLGVAAGASGSHHEKQEALMKEVTKIGDDLARAMVAKNVDRMLTMYAPGAISLPNYGPRMQGIDAFRQSHEQMNAVGMNVLAFESEPTEVWQAGDQVIEIGKFEITIEMPGMPNEIEDRGKYLTIYERDASGALKIKVETWNTDLNPMAMMSGSQEGEPAGPAPAGDRDDQEDADQVP